MSNWAVCDLHHAPVARVQDCGSDTALRIAREALPELAAHGLYVTRLDRVQGRRKRRQALRAPVLAWVAPEGGPKRWAGAGNAADSDINVRNQAAGGGAA